MTYRTTGWINVFATGVVSGIFRTEDEAIQNAIYHHGDGKLGTPLFRMNVPEVIHDIHGQRFKEISGMIPYRLGPVGAEIDEDIIATMRDKITAPNE